MILVGFNIYNHLSPIQQSFSRMMTLKKILNVHSDERNEHFFKLERFENIVTKEEIAPAGAISSFATMFSNVVCCSRKQVSMK